MERVSLHHGDTARDYEKDTAVAFIRSKKKEEGDATDGVRIEV
jgi:hypothetical protein